MPPTTSVPRPSFGPAGFIAPSEAAILAGVTADINSAFGGGLNPGLSTPQGQLASTETAVIGDSNATFLLFCNQVDPALNSGRMQDAIGRIYYMERIAGNPSVQPCVCAGLDTVTIPVGVLVRDENNVLWTSTTSGQIVNGSVTINFAATVNGPTPGPATLTIYQGVFGWESCVPTGDAALGRFAETPSEYEARRLASVAVNALGILDGIKGAVLAVPGVLDAYCTENVNGTSISVGGVLLIPNSIYICVLGGDAQAIADAIWTRKAPGCGYTGNTIKTVTDPNPLYAPPAPSYQVAFQIPTIVDTSVLVTLRNSAAVPADALAQIRTAIINAFAGLDGGMRATIGSTVFASRYYGPVALLGPWAQIIEIQVGRSGAVFTGSITGNTLTVSAVTSGTIAPGQLLQDSGVPTIASGTVIQTQSGGTPGGVGTYTLSISQSVSSEGMTSTTLLNDFSVNINEAPAVSANNIQLALQ